MEINFFFATSLGSPDFVVISKPHILDEEGIIESQTVVLDTVYTINPGEPFTPGRTYGQKPGFFTKRRVVTHRSP